MTALKKFARLESPGLWRETPQAQRRDVIVSVGEATLVIADIHAVAALAHWSLPALERLNPGDRPAVYSPGADSGETLELDDDTMIDAIETVRGVVAARRPRPGRLRNLLLGGGLITVLALGIFWMPGALIRHTASVVPPAMRLEIGHMALADMTRLSGAPCSAPPATAPLAKLAERLLRRGGEVVVLREGVSGVRHLPGQIMLVNKSLIEGQDGPDLVAGQIIAERFRAEIADPMIDLLKHAGLRATFRLLTTGTLDRGATTGYAETLLRQEPTALRSDELLDRFAAAGVASSPYAYAIDPSGERTLPLIEADPYRDSRPAAPVLSDGEWVALQGICGG